MRITVEAIVDVDVDRWACARQVAPDGVEQDARRVLEGRVRRTLTRAAGGAASVDLVTVQRSVGDRARCEACGATVQLAPDRVWFRVGERRWTTDDGLTCAPAGVLLPLPRHRVAGYDPRPNTAELLGAIPDLCPNDCDRDGCRGGCG